MSGIHVIQRTNLIESYDVIKATSTLKLPNSCTSRENNPPGSGIHGAFPEFIHGFFGGIYGVDTGIMYQNGKFHLFYYAFDNTSSLIWDQTEIPSNIAAKGSTVTFSTEILTSNKVRIRCEKGTLVKTLLVNLTTAAANRMLSGCKFVREMVLALNPESNGSYIVPAGVSYSSATFSNTTLTNNNGYEYPFGPNNSTVVKNLPDPGTPTHTYSGNSSSQTIGLFISDTSYGSM